MRVKEIFTISDFAKFSRTTRDTLIHYDRIGLLHPVKRGENGYRLYSPDQLALVNLIHTCQALGMRLSEIHRLTENRTPAQIDNLLGAQIKKINERITEWERARKLLTHLKHNIHSVLDVNTDEITVRQLPAEPIILGEPNDYSGGRNDYDALISFYNSLDKKFPELEMNYPVWGYFTKESVLNGGWSWPDRYYFSNPEGNDERPAALYVTGYGKGGYGKSSGLFKKMVDYTEANGYEISGPAYLEFPLNEISVSNPDDYLMKLMIQII